MLGELYIRLSADIKNLERELKRAERTISQYGQRMQQAGNRLSMAVTMPILGIGAAAIRSAGEMEALDKALQVTMRDAGYTTAQAKEELDALRKIAEAPGLDFEQAVKGSLRLQSVGFSAEQARKTLAEFANGVAAAGGSAQQLDRVTVQLAQIQSKGKVMNEDLMIIKENMPSISKAMLDAFGTADAEGIRKLGISTEQFVVQLTNQLGKMERVEGGISNSIINAGVSIKLFLASIGEELNKNLDIKGLVDRFSAGLGRLSEWFKGLDSNTKKLIINFALVLAAAGPMIKVIGLMGTSFGFAATNIARMGKLLSFMAGGPMPGFVKAFISMDTAMKATVIGATIAAVVALYGAYRILTHNLETATEMQLTHRKAQTDALVASQKQVSETEKLVGVLKNENATRMEKNAALEELKRLQPSIWEGLSIESASLDEINKRLAKNIKLIKLQSEAKVYQNLLDKEMQRQIEVSMGESEELQLGTVEKGYLALTAAFDKNATAADKVKQRQRELARDILGESAHKTQTFTERIAQLNKEIADLEGPTKALNTRIKGTGDAAGDAGGKLSELQKIKEKLRKELAANEEATKLYGHSVETAADKVKIIENAIDGMLKAGAKASDPNVLGLVTQKKEAEALLSRLNDIAGKTNQPVAPLSRARNFAGEIAPQTVQADLSGFQRMQEAGMAVGDMMRGLRDGTTSVSSAFQQLGITAGVSFETIGAIMSGTLDQLNPQLALFTDGLGKFGELAAYAAMTTATSLEQMALSGEASFAAFGKAALKAAADVVRAMIMQAVTAYMKNILAGPTGKALGPFALAVAGAAGAAAGGLFNKIITTLKIPALAQGGLAFGPSLAMVGDNIGARSNPEVIAPLDKLKAMFGDGMGGGNGFIASTRLDGRDLLIVLERAQKDKFRIT